MMDDTLCNYSNTITIEEILKAFSKCYFWCRYIKRILIVARHAAVVIKWRIVEQ
jgi:hypothetical protein